MNLRYLVCPLTLILLLWPSVYTQGCDPETPEDVLLEAQFLPADNATAYPEFELRFILTNESSAVQDAITAAQSETNDTISDAISLPDYYHDVCPTYRFPLMYKWWYFFYNNQQLKCFALHPVYITYCKTRYCNLKSNAFYWWYRCVQQWSYQGIWAVCADMNGMWSIRYVKLRLPTSCNCKQYWKYVLDQCQFMYNTGR
ncbi:hypothetical protein ACJMK2_009834 [Sinanodonta woodiana]|uniref:Uncharacterized protein n=1 Tax=Sinanodonta woodiana TaxID=1069815 RepID=A0ABD3VDK5_SINWO